MRTRPIHLPFRPDFPVLVLERTGPCFKTPKHGAAVLEWSRSAERQAVMPKRCGDEMCGNLIKKGVEPVRVAEKVFCDEECASNWQQQNFQFEDLANPFHSPRNIPPRRMNGG